MSLHSTIYTFKNYFAIVFSVFSKISCIQMNPKPKCLEDWKYFILFYFLRELQHMTSASNGVLLTRTYAIYLFWISLK